MKKVILRGTVTSGEGKGSFFVKLPWVISQSVRKLGFIPYPGTLNLKLSSGTDVKKLKSSEGIKIESPPGFHEGRCFEAQIMERIGVVVVVPDIPGYPDDLLEIIAPVNLRDTLGLNDGAEIEVTLWL